MLESRAKRVLINKLFIMLYTKEQKKIFKKAVKNLRSIEIDGESTQNLLQEIGHEEQMLRQLMMSMPMNLVNDYYDERLEYELSLGNDDVHPIKKQYEHRMKMIIDDIRVIHKSLPQNLLEMETEENDALEQCIFNIEIACDLANDECLSWSEYTPKEKTIDEKLELFYRKLHDDEQFFEYCSFQGTCHVVCSGSKHSYNITPFWEDTKGVPVEVEYDNEYKNFFVIEYEKPTNDNELGEFKTFYIELVKMFIRSMEV